MDILFHRYRSICEPNMIEAFSFLGFHVDEVRAWDMPENVSDSRYIQKVSDMLMQKKYTFVFSVNFTPVLSDVCNIFQIPYLCVVVDSPLLTLYASSLENKCNRIFIFDRTLYHQFYPRNPDCIFHLPLATSIRNHAEVVGQSDPARLRRFAAPISFIGSLYSEKCEYNNIRLDEYSRGYVDALIEAQLRVYGCNFIRECITQEVEDAFLKARPDLFHFSDRVKMDIRSLIAEEYIDVKIAEQERIRLLRYLSDRFEVHFFTQSDTSGMPGIRNRGAANSVTEMPLIFRQSAINLNITAKSIQSGLSLRVFDVLGCEGFLISNYQEELPDHFVIGEDLDVYTSFDDLAGKCEYYLSHENDRKEIAHNGFRKIEKYHTWDVRIAQMLGMAFPGQ